MGEMTLSLSCLSSLGTRSEVKSAPHSLRPSPLRRRFYHQRCMILPHDSLSSTASTLAVQRHPVQSRGMGGFSSDPPPFPPPKEKATSPLLFHSFPLSFLPFLPLFLFDRTVEVLPLYSPALILVKKESPPAVPENLPPDSLSPCSPHRLTRPAIVCETPSLALNPLECPDVLGLV
jgi:hypothetical protein